MEGRDSTTTHDPERCTTPSRYRRYRPVSRTRSPTTSQTSDPPRADNCRATSRDLPSSAAHSGANSACADAGHRILGHPDRGREEPRHEIHLVRTRCRHDHPARQRREGQQVRRDVTHLRRGLEHHDLVERPTQRPHRRHPQRREQSGIRVHRTRFVERQVQHQTVGTTRHRQQTAPRGEVQPGRFRMHVVEQLRGGRQGRVPAQVHLRPRGEPAQVDRSARAVDL